MPTFPYFNSGYSKAELNWLNKEPFDSSNPSKVLCTCGYWRQARFEHASDCEAGKVMPLSVE